MSWTIKKDRSCIFVIKKRPKQKDRTLRGGRAALQHFLFHVFRVSRLGQFKLNSVYFVQPDITD